MITVAALFVYPPLLHCDSPQHMYWCGGATPCHYSQKSSLKNEAYALSVRNFKLLRAKTDMTLCWEKWQPGREVLTNL